MKKTRRKRRRIAVAKALAQAKTWVYGDRWHWRQITEREIARCRRAGAIYIPLDELL